MRKMAKFQEYPNNTRYTEDDFPLFIGVTHLNVKPHYHPFVELSFVLEGSGIRLVNGLQHLIKPGVTNLYLPHHIHGTQNHPNQNPPISYCCTFDISLLTNSILDSECLEKLYNVGINSPPAPFSKEKITI